MSDKLVIYKDQRAERIKQSDIEVQIYTINSKEDYKQISNFEDIIVW